MIDTIRCHDNEDAKATAEVIGWSNIEDWTFNEDGTVTLILNCRVVDIKDTEKTREKKQ